MKKMNRILTILIVTFLFACNSNESQKQKQLDTWNERVEENESIKVVEANLSEPIDIYELKTLSGLTTTSGIVTHSKTKNLCVQGDSLGFYGFYYLIDKSIGRPFGILKIHTTDENWRFDSKNEKFAEITLESNKVAVWDSIKVGLSEQKLKEFIGDRFHYKKGTMIYSELDSYEGVFTILNDTIRKLTIKNDCKK